MCVCEALCAYQCVGTLSIYVLCVCVCMPTYVLMCVSKCACLSATDLVSWWVLPECVFAHGRVCVGGDRVHIAVCRHHVWSYFICVRVCMRVYVCMCVAMCECLCAGYSVCFPVLGVCVCVSCAGPCVFLASVHACVLEIKCGGCVFPDCVFAHVRGSVCVAKCACLCAGTMCVLCLFPSACECVCACEQKPAWLSGLGHGSIACMCVFRRTSVCDFLRGYVCMDMCQRPFM